MHEHYGTTLYQIMKGIVVQWSCRLDYIRVKPLNKGYRSSRDAAVLISEVNMQWNL